MHKITQVACRYKSLLYAETQHKNINRTEFMTCYVPSSFLLTPRATTPLALFVMKIIKLGCRGLGMWVKMIYAK